jgi:hypothetical protein
MLFIIVLSYPVAVGRTKVAVIDVAEEAQDGRQPANLVGPILGLHDTSTGGSDVAQLTR